MKLDRLMSILMYLLNHGRTSATKLAGYYEVTPRTIMRDIEALCQAGVPISSVCGINGGYEIMDTYVLDKQLVSKRDYQNILSALSSMASAYDNNTIYTTMEKIKLLAEESESTVEVDLSAAHENVNTNKLIEIIEKAIETGKVIEFQYTNNENASHSIEVEPVGVVYKWYNWYLVGYSTIHLDYRMYKLVRMDALQLTQKKAIRNHSLNEALSQKEEKQDSIKIVVLGKKEVKIKCKEYLNIQIIKECDNGDFEFVLEVPPNETFWYGVILSLGENVKVLEPPSLIDRIKENCQGLLKLYEEKI